MSQKQLTLAKAWPGLVDRELKFMKTKSFWSLSLLLGLLVSSRMTGGAQTVTQVSAGSNHSLFRLSDGSLWGLGYNGDGELGDGTYNNTNRPEEIVAGGVTAIAAGTYHSLFLESDGSLWGMGDAFYGELGDGASNSTTNRPEKIAPGGVAAIAAGSRFSLFLKSDGSLWAMGDNNQGQLGDGTNSNNNILNTNLPEQTVASNVTAIAAGGGHSLFLKSDGSLWGNGDNSHGQLGDGTYNFTNHPEQIVATNVTAIAAGTFHSLFLKSDGSLWGMGDNAYGQLGDGNITGINAGTNRPELIVSSGVVAIADGTGHSLFLKSDGSLWGMGYNEDGELGDGSNTTTNQPEQIVASGVAAIAAGSEHSLFLKTDGSLWGMGFNADGQLGDGTRDNSNQPELLVASDVTAIAAGSYQSFFIKSDGSLWAMGDNFFGQLGNGTFLTAPPYGIIHPEQILTSGVTAVASGYGHTLILKSNGSLWAMGDNEYGQLGDCTYTNKNVPEQILPSDVTAIAAGVWQSLFIKSDGSLWGMGQNMYGQLGDGTYNNTNCPARIVIESGPRLDLIKAVKPAFSSLSLGTNYQMQLSADMSTWTNYGDPFTATNASMVYPQYFDIENWGKLYFRLH